ncbi:LysM peptidoglycan-binding domain-containing protein [Selenihalanaerobacter shriftii]|uniref:Type IV pilus assembly protein PilQ n=1 Tax=Selenihalanaerobacter shriftii TaxID=142842 RepID=A0A1T4P3D1_9FIRM|nr:LysM peptidoglycan-binding domain-containing protein [Selenihalanaerobacter shriftii]SJZ86045.1 type IV pilus assembly protein PilQ [Selenihalanaerobacter shriftii]
MEDKTSKKIVIVGLLILLTISFSVGTMAEETKPLPGASKNINLKLKGVNLRDAFRALADVANMNIITDNSVKGKVTINLNNITFLESVELLAKTNGLSYRIVGNTVLVAPPQRLEASFAEKVTRVYKLKNSKPKEIKSSLNLLVNENSIRIDERTQSLVVTTYKGRIPEIERLITKLDQSRKQIVLQARIEEVSRDKAEELGISWGFGKLNLNPNLSETTDEENSNIVKIGSTELGYQAALDLLESNGDATLLANPQIATIDGEKASINISDKVPIITTVTTDKEVRDKVEFKDIGIKLAITPRVTNNGKIIVKVKPEVSTISGYVNSGTNSYPQISTRKAETMIRIQDGKTIAIGGLIKDKEIKNLAKVPLLGDLPILGKLFQNKSTTNRKSELIIFITPKIIGDGNAESHDMLKDKLSKISDGTITIPNESGSGEVMIVPYKYKTQESDTFWSVSQHFNISYTKIMGWSNIEYVRPLEAGEVLSIPLSQSRYYKVQKGDSLESIAGEYDIKVEKIKLINKISSIKEAKPYLVLPVTVKEEDKIEDFKKVLNKIQKDALKTKKDSSESQEETAQDASRTKNEEASDWSNFKRRQEYQQ